MQPAPIEAVVVAVAGFLLGSVPMGYLMVRVRSGGDVRAVGSGNIGATNVSRALGTAAGVVTLVLDACKGVAGAMLGAVLAGTTGAAIGGAAAVAGHCFTPWLGWRGGKGVATALGAFLVLAPAALGIAFGVLAILAVTTRYVSLGSLVGMATLVVVVWLQDGPPAVLVAAAVVAAIVFLRHHANIRRLLRGEEHPWGQR